MERNELGPKPKDEETDAKEEAEEESEAPSSLRRDGEQIIVQIVEGSEDVDLNPATSE